MKILFWVMLALGLIFGTAVLLVCANAATTSEKVTMTITCEPERALTIQVQGTDNPVLVNVEDWVAECKVYENGTKVYEGSFSATIPESRDAAVQEEHTVEQNIVEYLKQLRNADVPERE